MNNPQVYYEGWITFFDSAEDMHDAAVPRPGALAVAGGVLYVRTPDASWLKLT